MRDRHSGFITGLFGRNEIFLWISAAIFLGSIVVSYGLSGILDPYLAPMLQSFQQKASDGTLKLETLSLFTNNVTIAVYIYLGGLLIGVISAFLLISNGAFVGYVASKYPLSNFIIFTIPHGVFEITGIILAGAAGFKLGSIVLHFLSDVTKIRSNISYKNQIMYLLETSVDDFKDSLALFIIAVILLIIAAFIEANLSIAWGHFIQSSL
ncbi:MAG TPA: stage II sporulation protein M [Methanobacterium sp.]|nr:stage II sporulation protein M [Methanobacterium sp.]